jgi:hypothetical protein
MKKLWIVVLAAIIGLDFELTSKHKDTNSWKFDRDKYLEKPSQNIETLVLVSDILEQVKEENGVSNKKNGAIKKIEQDINSLQKIRRHLEQLDKNNEENEDEVSKDIKHYKKNKGDLISLAQKDIDNLIRLEHKLLRLEKITEIDHAKEKAVHKKHKQKLLLQIKEKIEHLLDIERRLIELTKKFSKENREAQTIYHETEFLKGPEIHDRETMSIYHAQYHDHLHKGISKYDPDLHGKIKNYLWGNT